VTDVLRLSFVSSGSAKSKGSMTSLGGGRMVESVKGSGDWRAEMAKGAILAIQATRRSPAPFSTIGNHAPVVVVARFRFARRGRVPTPTTTSTYDLDKLTRNLGDALVDAGVMVNDAQVVRWDVEKEWGPPGVTVEVFERVPA
jgi:hypothetical protein